MKMFQINQIMVGIVLGLGISNAALADSNWVITSNNNCKVYNSNPQPNETVTWSGACKEGKAHGTGTLQWYKDNKPTDTYVGDYHHGKMYGKGKYTWLNGDKYEGEWEDEKRTKGKFTWANGNSYDGEWLLGKYFHGQGTYIWANGSRYAGGWVDGKRTGFGEMRLVKNDTEAISSYKGKGKWEGNTYVLKGEFYKDEFVKPYVDNSEACKKRYVGEAVSVITRNTGFLAALFDSQKVTSYYKVRGVGSHDVTVEDMYGHAYRFACNELD